MKTTACHKQKNTIQPLRASMLFATTILSASILSSQLKMIATDGEHHCGCERRCHDDDRCHNPVPCHDQEHCQRHADKVHPANKECDCRGKCHVSAQNDGGGGGLGYPIDPIDSIDSTPSETAPVIFPPQTLVVMVPMVKKQLLSHTLHQTAKNISDSLDSHTNPTGNIGKIYNHLATLSTKDLKNHLHQLSPSATKSIHHAINASLMHNSQTVLTKQRDTIDKPVTASISNQFRQQIQQLRTSSKALFTTLGNRTDNSQQLNNAYIGPDKISPLPQDLNMNLGKLNIWTSGQGKHFKSKAHDVSPLQYTTAGSMVGGDYRVNSKTRVGLMGGVSHSDYKHTDGRGNGRVNSYEVGAYGSYQFTPKIEFSGVIGYGNNSVKGKRLIRTGPINLTAHQQHHDHAYYTMIDTSYAVEGCNGITLKPFMGAGFMYLDEDSYKETGAGNAGLEINGKARRHIQGHVGARLSKTLYSNEIEYYGFIKGEYIYRTLLSQSDKATSSFIGQSHTFTSTTGRKNHHIFSPGVGVTALFQNNTYCTLTYDGTIGKYQTAHTGFVKIGKRI